MASAHRGGPFAARLHTHFLSSQCIRPLDYPWRYRIRQHTVNRYAQGSTDMSFNPELLQAYNASHYRMALPLGACILQIGAPAPVLDDYMRAQQCRHWLD